MPLLLRGRSKARLEIYWSESLPVDILITSEENSNIQIYSIQMTSNKHQFELESNLFQALGDVTELSLIAYAPDHEEGIKSEAVKVQRCSECCRWGISREDGYCRHCGHRIRTQNYSKGFARLENHRQQVILSGGSEGYIIKQKEYLETEHLVKSRGKYEDAERPLDYVDILEEPYKPDTVDKFTRVQQLITESLTLPKYWNPPLACFQEQHQRTLWIYYPYIKKLKDWRKISALSYICGAGVELISTQDIVKIGIQLCHLVEEIHNRGHLWASLQLSDVILCRNKSKEISLYLRTNDIAWDEPNKSLLDPCLIPPEIFWEDSLKNHEVSEVYIIAIFLYYLKAKTSNLLSYNVISSPIGLPPLKLFERQQGTQSPVKRDRLEDYFEATINQATLTHPEERGYKTVKDLRGCLEKLHTLAHEYENPAMIFDVGEAEDVGDEVRQNDFTKNQDSVFVTTHSLETKGWGIFVVCDGITNASVGSGDMASRIVVETIASWWQEKTEEEQLYICSCASIDFSQTCEIIQEVVCLANAKILEAAQQLSPGEELTGVMGTTITIGIVHGNVLAYGWLGDSPLYRISPYGWSRLNSSDNERNYKLKTGLPLEECFRDGGNALTNYIGGDNTLSHMAMQFDWAHIHSDDYILACSDGIPDYIEIESSYAHHENYQMMRIAALIYAYEKDPLIDSKALAHIIVSCINRLKGSDNLSAVLVRSLPEANPSKEECYQDLKMMTEEMQKQRLETIQHKFSRRNPKKGPTSE